MTLVKITKSESTISVVSPYNRKFIEKAKDMSGKWKDPAWVFHVADESRVRDLCREVYGTDGESIPDVCTVKVYIGTESVYTDAITFEGRTIARARGRDSGARLGDGIVLEEGTISSGGSVKNWKTECSGLTVLIHDFPRARAEELDLDIVEDKPAIDKTALAEERNRLMARITEIDALLAQ